ncbi:MAG TPA: zf-HC2 domain-containing protein [Archangium sp.]
MTSRIDEVLTGRVLSAEDDAALRAHLRGCAACRDHYDRTMGVLRLARGGGDALAPGEAQRLETRALRLAKEVPATPMFPWRLAFAGAALAAALVITVLAWPRTQVGTVLAAGPTFQLDGVLAAKDAVIFSGAVLTTQKEDAAVLLSSEHGKRGLLLRPGTRVVVKDDDEVKLEAGRMRVQVKKADTPTEIRVESLRVVQLAAATYVVEKKGEATIVAVHQGNVVVRADGQQVELKDGQETTLENGVLAPAKNATAGALIEDRGDGTVWDAILRFLKQLIDTIAKALAGD